VISDVIRAVELGKQIYRKLVRIEEAEAGEAGEADVASFERPPCTAESAAT
jgi:hypothetical protein